MNSEKFEKMAKEWDEKLPNLAKALRTKDLQNYCNDVDEFDGWIRVQSSKPEIDEMVLVTDGKDVWMGTLNLMNRPFGSIIHEWSVVYDGNPPFRSTQIIAWMPKPSIPPNLK